jgi:hypothetical protein
MSIINSITDKSSGNYIFNYSGLQNRNPIYLTPENVPYCVTGSLGPVCINTGNNFINSISGGELISLNNLVFDTTITPLSIYFVHKWTGMNAGIPYNPFSIDCINNGVRTQIAPVYIRKSDDFMVTAWGQNNGARLISNNYKKYEEFVNKVQIDEYHLVFGVNQSFKSNKIYEGDGSSQIVPILGSSGEKIGNLSINQNYSLGELLVFSGLLSTEEKSNIYNYLCGKWCVNTFTGFKDIFIAYGTEGITRSINGGQTWNRSFGGSLAWASNVDISNNGRGVMTPFICYSPPEWWRTSNNGQDWSKMTEFPPGVSGFSCMAISNNGQYILAAGSVMNCSNGGNSVTSTKLYTSITQGNSWSAGVSTPSPSFNWKKTVNINNNGSVMVAGIGTNQVYLSYDYGNTWDTRTTPLVNPSSFAFSIDMSCNGQHMIGYTYETTSTTNVVISNTFGNTWRELPVPNAGIQSAFISDNGKYISIGDIYTNGRIFYSHDSGVSWAQSTIYNCSIEGIPTEISYTELRQYTDCDGSCDGQVQIFIPFNGNTPFISYDFGMTFWSVQSWRNLDPNMPNLQARSIAISKNNISAELFQTNGLCEGPPGGGGGSPLPSSTSSIFQGLNLATLIGDEFLEDFVNN